MSKVTWNYLTIAAGCWMLGEGARMVVMGLFYKDYWYNPNLFDIFFDWLPMVIIGLIFLFFGIREFYLRQKRKQMERMVSRNILTPAKLNARQGSGAELTSCSISRE